MKKSLSIALIRQRYVQDGGAERFVERAVSALSERDVALTVLARKWTGTKDANWIECNPFYIGRLWRDWSFARSVCRKVKRLDVDLIQSHERIACCDIYRAGDGVHREWLKQRRRILGRFGKFAIAINPYHRYVLAAEKALFSSPKLKAVICNSKMVKEEIKQYFTIADERLHVIYSGVDTDLFHPDLKKYRQEIRSKYNIPEDAVVFLFVGSGFERKGLRAVIDAMTVLPEKAYLLIVGKDKKSKQYQNLVESRYLDKRVVFAGRQEDVRPYYGAGDVLVLPTLYDPFPNVILEAMAAGLPVITSTKCGAAEIIDDGHEGFVCDAHDQGSLNRYMNMLLNQELSLKMGQEARKRSSALTYTQMREHMLGLYDEIL